MLEIFKVMAFTVLFIIQYFNRADNNHGALLTTNNNIGKLTKSVIIITYSEISELAVLIE